MEVESDLIALSLTLTLERGDVHSLHWTDEALYIGSEEGFISYTNNHYTAHTTEKTFSVAANNEAIFTLSFADQQDDPKFILRKFSGSAIIWEQNLLMPSFCLALVGSRLILSHHICLGIYDTDGQEVNRIPHPLQSKSKRAQMPLCAISNDTVAAGMGRNLVKCSVVSDPETVNLRRFDGEIAGLCSDTYGYIFVSTELQAERRILVLSTEGEVLYGLQSPELPLHPSAMCMRGMELAVGETYSPLYKYHKEVKVFTLLIPPLPNKENESSPAITLSVTHSDKRQRLS